MFKKGDYVIYGNNGICSVQDVTTLDIPGISKNRLYYLLKPVYASNNTTVYTPVDTEGPLLRPALSKDEADNLIKSIPDIPLIPLTNEKTLENTYKQYIRSNNCKAWVQLIKTIYRRKESRIKKGYKVTALDSRYYSLAETSLYGELAIVLDKPREEVKSCITSYISESRDGS